MTTTPTVLLHVPVNKGIMPEYALHLSIALSRLGLNTVLHTPADCEWPENGVLFPRVVDNQLNPAVELKFGTPRWALNRFVTAFYNSWQRWHLAREVHADIVHIQLILPWVDWGFMRLHRRTTRVICTVHDVTPHVFKLPSRVDRFLRRDCYHLAHGLIFHTTVNRDQFESVYSFLPPQTSVIPLGLQWCGPVSAADMGRSKRYLGIPEDRKVILMFGELRPNKGLDILVRAFEEVILQTPRAFLLIAGSLHPSTNAAEVQTHLQGLPPGSWKWHPSWIPKEALPHYFKAASAVALPYVAFTSQSGVLAQAYRYGLPIVASDVGGIGLAVREDESGLVVPPSDVTELAAALNRLLTDEIFWAECHEHIAVVAQTKYSWEQVARQTADFYISVLQDQTG